LDDDWWGCSWVGGQPGGECSSFLDVVAAKNPADMCVVFGVAVVLGGEEVLFE
jgi:hypothetical protein